MSNLEMMFTEKQQKAFEILLKPEIEVLGYGGAMGSGKSQLIRMYVVTRALKYAKSKHLIVRKSYPELHKNHISRFKMDYSELGTYNDQQKQFTFANGSTCDFMYCANESDTERLQGSEYETICIDEAQFHKKIIWNIIKTRLRTTRQDIKPKMILTFNPGGISHKDLKKLFIDRIFEVDDGNPLQYEFLPANVYDNDYIINNDPEYVKRLESLPEQLRKAYLEGDFSSFEGEFFTVSGLSKIKPFMISESDSMCNLYGSLDHGITHDTSFGLWYLKNGMMCRLFSYLNNGSTTRDHAIEIRSQIESCKYSNGHMPIKIWFDPSMNTKFRLSEMNSRALIDEYIDVFKDTKVQFVPANNNKTNGCALMRQAFSTAQGQPSFVFFDKYNENLVERLQSAVFDKNNKEIYLKMDGDDAIDEVRYGIVGLYGIAAQGKLAEHLIKINSKVQKSRQALDWMSLT